MTDSEHPTNLFNHLADLRRCLLISLVSWLVASALCYVMVTDIMLWLTQPLAAAFDNDDSKRLIFTSLPEAFITYIRLSMFAGFMVAFPVIATQLYRFIAPGLYRHEKHAVLPFMIAAPTFFYAGTALAYYYIFPMAWEFFVSFELLAMPDTGLPVELEARISEYLQLVTSIILAFGMAFQLPLVLVLLIKAGIISVDSLKRCRRYAIVGLLCMAAILTPPDIISQVGLFMALYALYEAAIIVGCFMQRKTTRTLHDDTT